MIVLLSHCPRNDLVCPLVKLRPETAEICIQALYVDATRTGASRRAHRALFQAQMSLMDDPGLSEGSARVSSGHVYGRSESLRRSGRRNATLCAVYWMDGADFALVFRERQQMAI